MTESNPYTAPSANLEQAMQGGLRVGGPRTLPMGRGWGWIEEGYGYFKRSPWQWILAMIVGAVIYIALTLIPIVGSLALSLTTYVWIAGLMLGCRAQDNGTPFALSHLFAGFQNPGRLILLSVMATLLSIVVVTLAAAPLLLSLASSGASDLATLDNFSVSPIALLLVLVAMLLLIPVMMALYFAPALIALNDVSIVEALKLSFAGCLKNIMPMLIYGIIAFVLLILGSIPLGLGLLVLFPVLTASIYVAYKDIFLEN